MTRYTPLPDFALQCKDINRNHFYTYCLILSYCWNPDVDKFDWTAPSSIIQLSTCFDIPRSTLGDHIVVLETSGLIKLHRYSSHTISLIPTVTADQSAELPVDRLNSINTYLKNKESSLSDSKEHNDGISASADPPAVVVEIDEFLKTKFVGETTRLQFAASGKSLDYFKAWFRYHEIKGEPINYACNSIKSDLPMPEICLVCDGLNGEHKSVVDEKGQPIMCPLIEYPHWTMDDVAEMYGVLETQ